MAGEIKVAPPAARTDTWGPGPCHPRWQYGDASRRPLATRSQDFGPTNRQRKSHWSTWEYVGILTPQIHIMYVLNVHTCAHTNVYCGRNEGESISVLPPSCLNSWRDWSLSLCTLGGTTGHSTQLCVLRMMSWLLYVLFEEAESEELKFRWMKPRNGWPTNWIQSTFLTAVNYLMPSVLGPFLASDLCFFGSRLDRALFFLDY